MPRDFGARRCRLASSPFKVLLAAAQRFANLISVSGTNNVIAAMLTLEVPVFGGLAEKQAAVLARLAPMAWHFGNCSRKSFIQGGQAGPKDALYAGLPEGLPLPRPKLPNMPERLALAARGFGGWGKSLPVETGDPPLAAGTPEVCAAPYAPCHGAGAPLGTANSAGAA